MRRLLDTVLSKLRTGAVHDSAPASDAALLRAFVERDDREALELLIRRHAESVWRTCLRVTGAVHDAQDAFQATWCILLAKGRSMLGGCVAAPGGGPGGARCSETGSLHGRIDG